MSIITNLKARSIKPGSKSLPHGGVVGLNLIPSTKPGHGKWVLRYVSPVTGKRRNAGLGGFPEITIADAGKLGSEFRALLDKGQDPLFIKHETNIRKATIPSFKRAAEIHHGELLPGWKSKKHGQQWLATLIQYAFPILGDVSVDKITPNDIAHILRPIWLTKPETAGRVKQRIHSVFAWAWAHGYCQSNPTDVVTRLLPKQPELSVRRKHMRSMPWRDIPQFVSNHLRTSERCSISQLILEFLILTAARSGEVRAMRWSEVNWNEKIWVIPAERMKAHREHRVPLTSRAVEILHQVKGLHEELVFPSVVKQTILSDMVLTEFIRGIYKKIIQICLCRQHMVFVRASGIGAVNMPIVEI